MNTKQRVILIAVAVVIVAMLLYPPFYGVHNQRAEELGGGSYLGLYYSWLFDGTGRVETSLLFAQWIAVGVIGAIAFVLSADKK